MWRLQGLCITCCHCPQGPSYRGPLQLLLQEVVGSGAARLVVFNLGYLPGSDKTVTTQEHSTVAAMQVPMPLVLWSAIPGGLPAQSGKSCNDGEKKSWDARHSSCLQCMKR